MIRSPCLALVYCALAACGPTGDTAPATADQKGPAEKAPQSDAAPAVATSPVAAEAVPAAFLGVWDYVKGSCDPASDLRIEIKQEAVEFYESHGKITKVTVESPDAIIVDLDMEGEGQKWKMATRYTLGQGGAILNPTSTEPGTAGEPLPLKKCPA